MKQHPPLPPSRYEVGICCRVSTASKTQVVSAGHQLSGLIADVRTIVRELKKVNVPVYFENEQLYSFDKEAELAISLHGAIAQGESENKSENIKWSLDKAAQNPDAQIYN